MMKIFDAVSLLYIAISSFRSIHKNERNTHTQTHTYTLDGATWVGVKIASTDDLRDWATSDLVLFLLDESMDPFDL